MTIKQIHRSFNHVVAFEVSKETLVVHVLPGDRRLSIPNKLQAVRRVLRSEIKHNAKSELGPLLIVVESTGGYERHVLQAGIELELSVHKAHGSRVRFFAKYLGLAAKTDPIDARVLALFGLQTAGLILYAPPSIDERALRELKARRDEIQAMLIAEKNRLEHVRHASVVKSIKSHIVSLRKALEMLECEIVRLIRTNKEFARKTRLMRTVIGVGPVTAVTLLAYLPELGTLTKGQVACLAGLAPINQDSGKITNRRHIQAGRSTVRRTLYMAALVALQRNPIIRTFAANLKERGKPFKVVITAVMRKLIVILNGILRTGEPWKHATKA
jgi:transposase